MGGFIYILFCFFGLGAYAAYDHFLYPRKAAAPAIVISPATATYHALIEELPKTKRIVVVGVRTINKRQDGLYSPQPQKPEFIVLEIQLQPKAPELYCRQYSLLYMSYGEQYALVRDLKAGDEIAVELDSGIQELLQFIDTDSRDGGREAERYYGRISAELLVTIKKIQR